MAMTSLVSVPPAMMLGSWSDRAGRRSVMVLPFILSLLSGGVLLAMVLVKSLSVYWCLLAAAFIGLTGGHVSIFLSSFSFLADITVESSSSRTLRMAIAESMIFVGGMVGFLLGGFLEQEVGLVAAFGAYIACHVLAILYILLWLQDPRPINSTLSVLSTENGVQESGVFILKYTRLSFRAVLKRRLGQDRLKLHLLILCTFINNLVAVGEYSINLWFHKMGQDWLYKQMYSTLQNYWHLLWKWVACIIWTHAILWVHTDRDICIVFFFFLCIFIIQTIL